MVKQVAIFLTVLVALAEAGIGDNPVIFILNDKEYNYFLVRRSNAYRNHFWIRTHDRASHRHYRSSFTVVHGKMVPSIQIYRQLRRLQDSDVLSRRLL